MEVRSRDGSGATPKGRDAARSLGFEADELRKGVVDLKELVRLVLRESDGSENEEHADREAQSGSALPDPDAMAQLRWTGDAKATFGRLLAQRAHVWKPSSV